MKLLICVLAVLLIKETLAWDMWNWDHKWWKQNTAPSKHKKHHKHHRHHHHRPQTCIPVTATTKTLSAIPGEPTGLPDLDPFYPYNLGGKLTDSGATCSNLLSTQVVSYLVFLLSEHTPTLVHSLLDSMQSFLAISSLLRHKTFLVRSLLEVISMHMLTLSTCSMERIAQM